MDENKSLQNRKSLWQQNQRLLNALEYRNVQLHSLFRSLPDQYYLFSSHGICKEFLTNDLNELIINPERMGDNVVDLFEDASTGELIEEYIKNAASTGLFLTCNIKITDLLNQKRFYECRFSATSKTEVMMIVRDVTNEELYKNKLKVKVDELKRMNEKLNKYIKSNEELEKFAYIASHDLKEPIRNISFYAQYLKKELPKSSTKNNEYVDQIISRTFLMKNLIDDLLLYSSVDNQDLVIEKIDLLELINEVKNSLKVLIEQNDATINVKTNTIIEGDRFMFHRLFYNLIQNSIKYRSEKKPKIIIDNNETKNNILIKVSDNGIGISKQYVEYVFGLFKKIKNNHSKEGAGLGLSICRRVMERHFGEIYIDSDLGKGSIFNIKIPKTYTNLL